VLEWLTLLLRIREVPGLNIDPETGYPECFRLFYSVPPGDCRDSTLQLGHDRFLPHTFKFIITYHPFIRLFIVWVTKKASLNKLQITTKFFRPCLSTFLSNQYWAYKLENNASNLSWVASSRYSLSDVSSRWNGVVTVFDCAHGL
jgi:hypothetical protein